MTPRAIGWGLAISAGLWAVIAWAWCAIAWLTP